MVPNPDEPGEHGGGRPACARCRVCGRRVARADPGCPEHGRVPQPEGWDPDSSGVIPSVRAAIPGYRTLHLIGHGGFGRVYSAERERGGHPVAIKIARRDRPGAARRLEREMAALAAIGPPWVPAVLGGGELEDGTPYLVMEHVELPTLADHMIARGGPMAPSAVAALVEPTLLALEAIHAAGYVHRDLKPENVLAGGAEARIIDLGLIGRAAARGRPREPDDDEAAGTAEYMAPEQCEGAADVDARADLYAMGVILHELLAGQPPFWGPPAAVLQAHRAARPPRLSTLVDVTPAIEELVLRCLAKDRDDRPPSARALREALARAFADARAKAAPDSPPLLRSPAPRSLPSPVLSSIDAAGRERRKVGLVLFRSDADVVSLGRRLLSLGGQLAYASGDRRVAVYSHDVGDNPARRALRAARELVKRGAAARALLDLALVTVQTRSDGTRRFLSPLFAREESFPTDADPEGVFAMPAAAAALPELAERPPENDRGWVRADASRSGPIESWAGGEPRDPTLVGRETTLAALVASARRAAGERVPTITSVIAPPGHGKSRLARALAAELDEIDRHGEVIAIRAREAAYGDADRALKELLQQALTLPATAPPDAGRALLERRLGPDPAAVSLLSLALGWTDGGAPQLAPLHAAPGALRAAIAKAAGAALGRRAAEGPLFVVLDDAHHADEATLAALEYAALAESGAPLFVCALGRPAFEDVCPGWGERAAARTSVRLGPLDDASARALCRSLLLPAEDVPEPAVARLVARAEAVPLYLVELVRGLERAGIVRRSGRGDAWFLATDELDSLPDLPLIEWLAQREIDELSPPLQAHARLVAVLGADVMGAEIDGVLRRLDDRRGASDLPLDARVATRRLLTMGVLALHGDGRLGFRHALVREAIAAATPEALRRRIHLAAAEYYRSAEAIPDGRRLAQLGAHAAAAGLGAVAAAALLTLAEAARARHAYLDAERCYSRAIEAMETPSRDALRGRGLMRYRLGRHDDALADLARAREIARAEGDAEAEVDLLLDEATALDWMDDYARSEERVLAAKARAEGLASRTIGARLLLGIGRSAHRNDRDEEAASLLARAAAEAEPLGDEGYETLVIALLLLSFILPGLARVDEARSTVDRAIALCEARRDGLHVVPAINSRAILRALAGDKDGMIADYARVLSLARELGHAMLEIVGHFNLGEYLYLMDDLDAAEPHARRAAELERRRMGDGSRPVIALLDARLRFHRGDERGAREVLAELARLAELGAPAMAPAEEVLANAVDLATRGAGEAEWDALEARSAAVSFGQEAIEVLETRALAALRRGDREAAARALGRTLAAAARIPNVMGERLRRLQRLCQIE